MSAVLGFVGVSVCAYASEMYMLNHAVQVNRPLVMSQRVLSSLPHM